MAARSKKFELGQKVEYQGEPVTVVLDYLKQPAGTANVRDRYGYVQTVKYKDLKELPTGQ
jgi:hypothetical protein